MLLIKYLLFFASAIISAIGSGAVIAGVIIYLVYYHLLPAPIVKLLSFDFLESLPKQLFVLGIIVCLGTLVGCCGAVIGGKLGRWLLITYIIEMTVFVALNIVIAVVLHLAHQKTSSRPVTSALMMNPTITLNDKFIKTPSLEFSDSLTTAEQSMLVRQRRGLLDSVKDFAGKAYSTVGDTVHSGVNAVGNTAGKAMHTAKDTVSSGVHTVTDTAGKAMHTVKDTVSSGVYTVTDTAGKAINTVGSGVHAVGRTVGSAVDLGKTAVEAGVAGLKLAEQGATFVVKIFKNLDEEEENMVKWIRPILGRYTAPIFRITDSTIVMSVWMGAIIIEILFILMSIYLATTKVHQIENYGVS